MTPRRCQHCGRLACAAFCLALGSAVLPRPVLSQLMPKAERPIGSTTAVSIGELFVTAPMQPMLASVAADLACGDALCYRGVITVRANNRWQLQVRVDPSLALLGTVAWRPPVAGGREVPLDATWSTVLTSPVPTAGSDVALQFAVKRIGTLVEGSEPLAQLVSLAVQYRVIGLP